jgi:cysteine desulfurase
MLGLKEMALSSGSACLSSQGEPSYVLNEIGLKPDEAAESFRVVFGRENTEEEVQFCIEKITKMVQRIRVLSTRGQTGRHEGPEVLV